jgi:hypothetical protein
MCSGYCDLSDVLMYLVVIKKRKPFEQAVTANESLRLLASLIAQFHMKKISENKQCPLSPENQYENK